MPHLYRLHDAEPRAAILLRDKAEAKHWNTPEHGFGIFATVNDFAGARRKENLTRINAWPVDIDTGTKAEQAKRILGAPLAPSMIVETKRGYQVYWCAIDGRASTWNAIVLERLVPYFGADKNARDLCRILRVPGFLHLKNPADPFEIKLLRQYPSAYTERQMAEAFPWVPDKTAHEAELAEAQRAQQAKARDLARQAAIASGADVTETFWEAVWNLDSLDALTRLSGSRWVSGEVFTFKRQSNGNHNILVDGKGTSCFVDANGKIGSLDKGGPTVAQWLRWYRLPWPEVVEALKSIYPHLVDVDEAQRKARRS